MSWNLFPLVLTASERITPSVLHLAFERADGESLDYTPGQFLNVHFEWDGKLIHRSYSIANAPCDDGRLEIAMSPVEDGRATELLSGLKPGDEIQASGPYGRFVLRDDEPCRYVLVGTGTGVTPYRAMLPQLRERLTRGGFTAEILIGVWNADELLYGSDFLTAADGLEGLNIHACYSRAMPDAPAGHEHSGYVQTRFDELDLNPECDVVYLCGNPNMVDAAFSTLKELGFKVSRIRREKYLPSRD